MATPLSTRKKLVFSLVLAAFLWLVVELVCLGGLWALRRYRNLEYQPSLIADLTRKHRAILKTQIADRSSYLMFDPDLGWSIRPNSNKPQYKSNSRGLRATREYELRPAAGIVRVAAFGDSFTHASGVPTGFSWQERLEVLDPALEVMNFGIPGSDPGQALLHYRRDGIPYRPAVVLIGLMSENIYRMVNTFRPFYFPRSGIPFSKPRFAVEQGRLVLIENPIRSLDQYRELLNDPGTWLPRLGERDYFYRRNNRRSRCDFLPSVRFSRIIGDQYLHQPIMDAGGRYNPRSEAYGVTFRVLDQFYRETLANGSLPILVMYPQRKDLRLRHEGKKVIYQPLLDELRRRGYRVIDLADGFERYDPKAGMVKKGFLHYPKEGNEMAARWIHDGLVKEGLTTPEGVRKALAAARAPEI